MPKKIKVSPETVKAYPLTVSGYLIKKWTGAIIFQHKRKKYAVNGIAQDEGYRVIDPIWKPNEAVEGCKMDIGGLVKMGNKL